VASDVRKLALETFLTTAGPALVRDIAEILGTRGIQVMPLKGVLLQKLVYGPKRFRPISDVDVLVPEAQFYEAYNTLRAAGFSNERWEPGDWQVTMQKSGGPPLTTDLHRLLSRTPRSRLTVGGLFERGATDTGLFGVPVVIPSADDLFAHLVLHATLHWISVGQLHRPQDFQAVAESLSLDSTRCAAHLRRQGLTPHALVLLPRILEKGDAPFVAELIPHLKADQRDRVVARTIQTACSKFEIGHPARRLAGLALAPSLARAAVTVVRDRLSRHPRIS
jgi:hypothetical protein